MDEALARLNQQAELTRARKTFSILNKLLANIVQDPNEEKYRRVRLTNAKIASAIVQVDGAQAFLLAVGFEEAGEFLQMGPDQAAARAQAGLDRLSASTGMPGSSGRPLVLGQELVGHTADVRCCCFMQDGTIVSGSLDNNLRVWSPNSSDSSVLSGHTSSGRADPGVLAVVSVPIEGGGKAVVASAARDGQIIIWDVQQQAAVHKISGHGEGIALTNSQVVSSLSMAPTGEVLSGGWDKTARLWTVSAECLEGSGSGRHFNRLKLEGHEVAINAVLALPNGDVASASGDGTRVGLNIMDPPQTVYSKSVLFTTFDLAGVLHAGETNHVGALLGNYKWGYTDQWVNMTKAGGPNGSRALMLKVRVIMADGSTHTAETQPAAWESRRGPVLWDHLFHGESFDGTVDFNWAADTAGAPGTAATADPWQPAVAINPPATAATGMQVISADGKTAIALGTVKPTLSPPLRVAANYSALSVTEVHATDTGRAFIYDFGFNMAGMVTLELPVGHKVPKGTVLRIEHGEVVQGPAVDIAGMCKLCSRCCYQEHDQGEGGPCDTRGEKAVCNTYCHNPAQTGKGNDTHPLRHEPCFPHQSYTPGFPANGIAAHDTPDRYIGDL
eukprot:g2102.t1